MITPTPRAPALFMIASGDLLRELFLNLQTSRDHVDNARHLRQSEYTPVRQVAHVTLPDEGQQMVLAQGVHLDVLIITISSIFDSNNAPFTMSSRLCA
jgi:hypothetical protein